MTTTERLPDELLFELDGHLSDIGLACIGDGELALVGALSDGAELCPALAHVEACEHCAQRLGEAALLSIAASTALTAAVLTSTAAASEPPAAVLAPLAESIQAVASVPFSGGRRSPVPLRARRPLPVAAIAAAAVIAIVTAGPAVLGAAQGLRHLAVGVTAAAPFLSRVVLAFARAPWVEGPMVLALRLASAVVLVGIGVQVARMTSRAGSMQQGGV